MTDAQLSCYRGRPQWYATIADKIDLVMRISRKPCAGGDCFEGSGCRRHDNSAQVAARYSGLVNRWRRVR